MKEVLIIYSAVLVVMSLVTGITYAWDKHLAKNGEWRISEKTLLLMTFFFGAVGALLGRNLAHHKTKKWYFTAVIYLSLVIQLGALGFLIYTYFFN